MARIGVIYDKDIKERVFTVFSTAERVHNYSLSVSANPTTIAYNGTSTISATLTDNNAPVNNATITFSYGGSSYTSTTNSNGVATHTYTGTTSGTNTITASYGSVSSSVNVTVQEQVHTYSLSIASSSSTVTYGNNVTVTGTLLMDGNGYGGQTVTIYDGSTSLGTCTT